MSRVLSVKQAMTLATKAVQLYRNQLRTFQSYTRVINIS